jgi:NAD+ synthase (glutamine-hydrolysing)
MKFDPNQFKDFGYVRVAAVAPEVHLCNPIENAKEVLEILDALDKEGVEIACFPELGLTGYSLGDLFFQDQILNGSKDALSYILEETKSLSISFILGFPWVVGGRIFNCAGFIANGKLLGVVPKSFLPNTFEFYEERWFTPAKYLSADEFTLNGNKIPIGNDLIFCPDNRPDLEIGIEICEDLWAVEPPSGKLAIHGANVLFNTSASPETLGKSEYRSQLVSQQSARCNAAYIYSSAGVSESTTDVVYSGHCLIAENGSIVNESKELKLGNKWIISDIDYQKLNSERMKNRSFTKNLTSTFRKISFSLPENLYNKNYLLRKVESSPFVPNNPEKRKENCKNIFDIQIHGLCKRIISSSARTLILGISGGLDSTLAVLVAAKSLEKIGYPKNLLHAYTLPGFGTTNRTKNNAIRLAELLGAKVETISIVDSVMQHFKDIGHDPKIHDTTYENAQARERTQILMDLANKLGGIVIGTGDLSELALGWCTYNADQMSMYNVNSGVPKTLVRYVVEYCAENEYEGEMANILSDICNTPISPELLPPDSETILQETEEIIGPYLLHDFFLYNFLRLNYPPKKIFALAKLAFEGKFSEQRILETLKIFYRRFFQNQFKRSAMPDGVKVGSVALSPRGDWRMPSDVRSEFYIKDLEEF